ncbi:uncharacterized protein LOC113235912 [Hyposmocoma kahamanoa]|uniref:uncharacterized protein LOC113235912 n=1 Tax=Hyposmocoma kahamanoa TaxID=1477025 RepID=UPI000E6D8103|nr:uncharacterized protein LOC113235912 [Hyposmocoma kahamanoa]
MLLNGQWIDSTLTHFLEGAKENQSEVTRADCIQSAYSRAMLPATVLHWNYRGFTEFPLYRLEGEESDVTDIYLKENLISRIPSDIGKLVHLESLYLSGNDITQLPREISKLQCLKCLDLSGNRLRCIPDEIGEVKSLKFLILDENELTEIPLRIAELRFLRYLSVCDNRLEWLPQRPVYNYHHCEFRFWRNTSLRTIPYSLWYHMLRDQQTRSLNIGCLIIPKHQQTLKGNRCRLKFTQNSRVWDIDLDYPPYRHVQEYYACSPPSLYEFTKRKIYQIISDTAKKLSTNGNNTNIYLYSYNSFSDLENRNDGLESYFENMNMNTGDVNGNSLTTSKNFEINKKNVKKYFYVPADIVKEYFDFLPCFIKQDLYNGPMSKCENTHCKKPVFDYVIYEYCLGTITLIDKTEQVILSAVFCSKSCSDIWKRGKNVLSWKLLKDHRGDSSDTTI